MNLDKHTEFIALDLSPFMRPWSFPPGPTIIPLALPSRLGLFSPSGSLTMFLTSRSRLGVPPFLILRSSFESESESDCFLSFFLPRQSFRSSSAPPVMRERRLPLLAGWLGSPQRLRKLGSGAMDKREFGLSCTYSRVLVNGA